MEDLLTPQEVSKLLGVSLASVYRHLKSGVIEGLNTPDGVRISSIALAQKTGAVVGKKVGTGWVEVRK